MTVGGTGDVLSGLVAGMLAKNRNALQAVSAAVFVNGLAGAAAQEKFGLHILATDVCDNIPSPVAETLGCATSFCRFKIIDGVFFSMYFSSVWREYTIFTRYLW